MLGFSDPDLSRTADLEPGDNSHVQAVLVRVILVDDWCEKEGAVIDPKFHRATERDLRASSEIPSITWFAAVMIEQ
jgi:hypothetical protein